MKMLALKVKKKNEVNLVLFCLMILLVLIGCVFVYSASSYSAKLTYGDEFFFLKKQVFGICVGLLGFLIFSFIDYKKLERKHVVCMKPKGREEAQKAILKYHQKYLDKYGCEKEGVLPKSK